MSILIIDDEPDIQSLLTRTLQSAGYREVIAVASAHEAFAQLDIDDQTNADPEIDLILTALTIGEVNGIEAIQRIKANRRLQDIPIIVITRRTEPEGVQRAFDAGAMDYITKPLNQIELLARVRSAMSLKREMDSRRAREQELLDVAKQLEEVNERLQRLSALDPLLGIANRRRFEEVLDLEWRRAVRYRTPLSLMMLDIDTFKAYNDTYGHQSGDECLKKVATALASALKRPGDLVARYGGEEFVTVLPSIEVAAAAKLAETLRFKIEALHIEHAASTISPYVTISIGVATTVPERDATPAQLIAAADQALYQAKQSGRNQVRTAPSVSGMQKRERD